MVNFDLMISKIEENGIRGNELELMKGFFKHRIIFINERSTLSTDIKLRKGTPQGSPLSSLLFIIFINNNLKPHQTSTLTAYADNVVLLTANSDPFAIQHTTQITIDRLENWYCTNKMQVNTNKTKGLVLRHPNKQLPASAKIELRYRGEIIE